MKFFNNTLLIILLITSYSCVNNEEPDLTTYEPYITISFYDSVNKVITTAINKISAEGYKDSIAFADSATTFRIPLDINSSETVFIINWANRIDTLAIGYEPRIEDQFDVLKFIMDNPTVLYNSYDSVIISCDTVCISDDAVLKIY